MGLHSSTAEDDAMNPTLAANSNILGATGLSRGALRRLYAENGLFGADSSLSALEQAGIYAELQLPAGSVPPHRATQEVPNHGRIAAIRAVARNVLRRESGSHESQLALARQVGVQDRVIAEIVRTVCASMIVFGVGGRVCEDVALGVTASMAGNTDVAADLAAA